MKTVKITIGCLNYDGLLKMLDMLIEDVILFKETIVDSGIALKNREANLEEYTLDCHDLGEDFQQSTGMIKKKEYNLKQNLDKLTIALEEIIEKSQDNWAAARAEEALGRGKIAVTDG